MAVFAGMSVLENLLLCWEIVGGDGGVVRRWRVVVHALDFGKYLS